VTTVPAGQGDCPNAQSCAAALGDDLGWALGTLFRSYKKAVSEVVGDLPGGPRGYQVLTMSAGGLAGTQIALAQRLGVDRTVMTYLLDDLERAGLIKRQLDPTDRRARRIVATERGHARTAELQRRLRQVEDALLAGLDADERAHFRAMLSRLASDADATDPGHNACDTLGEIGEAKASTSARPRRRGVPAS
jgi:DNA-binding MarR family transcriptional regulator